MSQREASGHLASPKGVIDTKLQALQWTGASLQHTPCDSPLLCQLQVTKVFPLEIHFDLISSLSGSICNIKYKTFLKAGVKTSLFVIKLDMSLSKPVLYEMLKNLL